MTKYEKKSLFGFLSIYLISSIFLISLIFFLFYKIEYNNLFETQKYKMQNESKTLASKIILTHMQNSNIDRDRFLKNLIQNSNFEIAFFDKNKKVILSNIENSNIDLSKNFYSKNTNLYLIDRGAFLHLGVDFIAIKEIKFNQQVEKLKKKLIYTFLISTLFIVIVSFFLSKLFLKPIKDEIKNLDKFIKDTTHELNTPISALIMSIHSMERDKYIDSVKLKRIEVSAKRISNTYQDLTYMLFSEKVHKEREILNLKDILTERVNYFEDLAKIREINFKLDLKNLFFEINRVSIERLFDNLISNAIKYSNRTNSIKIYIRDNSIVVEDEGIGIKKSELKEIFNRYKRVNRDRGGFGIGLNIVFDICSEYNIKIDVESEVDIGSKFELIFKNQIKI